MIRFKTMEELSLEYQDVSYDPEFNEIEVRSETGCYTIFRDQLGQEITNDIWLEVSQWSSMKRDIFIDRSYMEALVTEHDPIRVVDEIRRSFLPRTKDGKEYRIYAADGCQPYFIHGAVKHKNGWVITQWDKKGFSGLEGTGLVPVPKRRWKTVEELLNGGYSYVLFEKSGQIRVRSGHSVFIRETFEAPEQASCSEWSAIFTILE